MTPCLSIGSERWDKPRSIAFTYQLCLSDVSCSPYRETIVRLAAAQAAISSQAVERDR